MAFYSPNYRSSSDTTHGNGMELGTKHERLNLPESENVDVGIDDEVYEIPYMNEKHVYNEYFEPKKKVKLNFTPQPW